jgi:hypothetical protein
VTVCRGRAARAARRGAPAEPGPWPVACCARRACAPRTPTRDRNYLSLKLRPTNTKTSTHITGLTDLRRAWWCYWLELHARSPQRGRRAFFRGSPIDGFGRAHVEQRVWRKMFMAMVSSGKLLQYLR